MKAIILPFDDDDKICSILFTSSSLINVFINLPRILTFINRYLPFLFLIWQTFLVIHVYL